MVEFKYNIYPSVDAHKIGIRKHEKKKTIPGPRINVGMYERNGPFENQIIFYSPPEHRSIRFHLFTPSPIHVDFVNMECDLFHLATSGEVQGSLMHCAMCIHGKNYFSTNEPFCMQFTASEM